MLVHSGKELLDVETKLPGCFSSLKRSSRALIDDGVLPVFRRCRDLNDCREVLVVPVMAVAFALVLFAPSTTRGTRDCCRQVVQHHLARFRQRYLRFSQVIGMLLLESRLETLDVEGVSAGVPDADGRRSKSGTRRRSSVSQTPQMMVRGIVVDERDS